MNRSYGLALVAFVVAGAAGLAAGAGTPVFIRSNVSDLWYQNGQVDAMNSVFGKGNWQDLRLETSNPKDVFGPGNSCIMMEGGNDQADELNKYIQTNQALIEGWVKGGGRLIINSAPNEGGSFNMGFGVTLNYWDGDFDSVAVDPNHPVYKGPWGNAGSKLHGDYFNHATVSGKGLSPITVNASNGNYSLAEMDFGAGHVIFGGETLDFFYSHPLWTQPDTKIYLENLISYNCRIPAPGTAGLLGLAGLAAARRRR